MGSAGTNGPTKAFRLVIEHDPGEEPLLTEVLEALQESLHRANFIEVHPGGKPCDLVGHLQGDPCPRCNNLGASE